MYKRPRVYWLVIVLLLLLLLLLDRISSAKKGLGFSQIISIFVRLLTIQVHILLTFNHVVVIYLGHDPVKSTKMISTLRIKCEHMQRIELCSVLTLSFC